jgi:hypothetical protein
MHKNLVRVYVYPSSPSSLSLMRSDFVTVELHISNFHLLGLPVTLLSTGKMLWSSCSGIRSNLLLLEKPPVAQLLKNFATFYGTRRFITVFTRAQHRSLSWARWNQSVPPHFIYLRSVISLLSLFWKMKGGLWDNLALCLCIRMCLSVYRDNVFVFSAVRVVSVGLMRSPWCLCVRVASIIFPFSVRSVSYQRKVRHYFFRELVISSHPRLIRPTGVFWISHENPLCIPVRTMHAPYRAHGILLVLIILIIFQEVYKLYEGPCYAVFSNLPFLFRPTYSSQHTLLKYLQSVSETIQIL